MAYDPTTLAAVYILLAFIVIIIVCLAIYVYSALALMTIAKRTKTQDGWLAWIPIANYILMANIAQMHWWPILLIIPYTILIITSVFLPSMPILLWLGILFMIAFMGFYMKWNVRMFERLNRPSWWAFTLGIGIIGSIFLLMKLPTIMIIGWILSGISAIVYMIFLGIGAWGKEVVVSKRQAKN